MTVGLLHGCDDIVLKWYCAKYNAPLIRVDRTIGLLEGDQLIGAIIFHYWNGNNVEISYYGPGTMKAGIVRYICMTAITVFGVSRMTAVVNKKNKRLLKSLMKLGFRLEGVQRCYFGRSDCNRNAGVRLVMFRERLEQLAYPDNATTNTPALL